MAFLTPWSRRNRQTANTDPAVPLPEWARTYMAFMDGELQRLEASQKDLVAAINSKPTR